MSMSRYRDIGPLDPSHTVDRARQSDHIWTIYGTVHVQHEPPDVHVALLTRQSPT
jgi:hypothetical protein